MFRYLGEKISTSDTNTDVYHCGCCFIFCTVYMCFVLVLIDVTAIKCIISTPLPGLIICTHIYCV